MNDNRARKKESLRFVENYFYFEIEWPKKLLQEKRRKKEKSGELSLIDTYMISLKRRRSEYFMQDRI